MIKLGTVPFVNAKPLVYPMEKGIVKHEFEIVYSSPSNLSILLENGEIDIGLIPVAELIRKNGDYKIVRDISISSNGEVDSVVLVSKKSIEDIRKVALDRRSQSSSSLLKIILQHFYGNSPDYYMREYDKAFFDEVDAGMLIGDTGLRFLYSPPDNYQIYDLGKIWTSYTKLPFVYAVLALNSNVDLGDNINALISSKSHGLEIAFEIACMEYKRIGISKEFCYNYISNRIKYDLGDKEIEAILRFSDYMNELGIGNKIDKLEFYE